MRKISIIFLIVLLLSSFQNISHHVVAKDNGQKDVEKIEAIVVAENNEYVQVYEDEYGEKVKTLIPNGSHVVYAVNDTENDFIQITFYDPADKNEQIIGYVNRNLLIEAEQNVVANNEDDAQNVQEQVEEESENTTEESTKTDKKQQEVEQSAQKSELIQPEQKKPSQIIQTQAAKQDSKRLKGIALKSSTHVYADKSTGSKVLKSYRQGHTLIFNTEDDREWYRATVYINGVKHTGYIFAKDVDIIDGNETKKEGNAVISTVSVYDRPSKDAKQLKSYPYGQKLIYYTHSSKWHKAIVIINGKRHSGYIYHEDITPKVQGAVVGESLTGVGSGAPTNVYASMSRDSQVLKSYNRGHVLKFKEYTDNWYIATVYIKGVPRTGYINTNDISNSTSGSSTNPNTTLSGIAQHAQTHVYSGMSKQSAVLKSYAAGHQLKYRSHNSEWYAATVYVNGVRHTGYIYHQDVGNAMPSINNYALKQPTNIYASTSRNSNVLKSYKQGHLLKFQPYGNNWYRAVVFVSGERKVGYIHHDDVGEIRPGKTVVIDAGHGGSDPGASSNGIIEKSLALSLSNLAKRMLEDAGINVIMTRTTDQYITLGERSRKANDSNADLFLSIHGNAFNGTASGIETYWYDKYASAESERLARSIQDEVIRQTNGRNRGVKKGNFHVIRETKIPSALLEVGFIDHPEEAEKLKQASYQRSIVQGILNGILSFLR